jgi:hypothetical protein
MVNYCAALFKSNWVESLQETDFGLLAHLTTNHGTSLKFQAAKTEDGTVSTGVLLNAFCTAFFHVSDIDWSRALNQNQLHIVARQQKDKMAGKHGLPPDFVFVSGKSRNIVMVPFVERPLETVATLPLVTRRSKIRELQACGADDATIGRYVPNDQAPIRQYYRSKTNQPMLDVDWEIDSDDESDPWVHKISEAVSALHAPERVINSCLKVSNAVVLCSCAIAH